jgi:hypothetical protein
MACAEAMSVTKQFSRQLSHAADDPPKQFLVLRLAHTGSSWLSAMIGAQNDTYITREAIYPMHKPQEEEYVESLGKQGVMDYLERALAKPSGNILKSEEIQFLCYNQSGYNGPVPKNTSGVSLLTLNFHMQPKTCACLRDLGSDCPLKWLGLTVDPTNKVLKDNLDILTTLQEKHPNMPVLVYRRSNVVKKAIASGGLRHNENGTEYGVKLHRRKSPLKFIQKVREAVEADKVLRQAGQYFRNVKTVSYEDLAHDPQRVMEQIFEFIGMPGRFESWMASMSDKRSPEDLRLLYDNFDTLDTALERVSPCLARQFRASTNEAFPEPCPDL